MSGWFGMERAGPLSRGPAPFFIPLCTGLYCLGTGMCATMHRALAASRNSLFCRMANALSLFAF